VDEETLRYAAIIKIKQSRLQELEEQAAGMGIYYTPPHIAMEIDSLKEELGMMDVAIESPARTSVGDELGPRGRFVVNWQQNQDIKKSIAAILVKMETGFKMQRNWIILIGLIVVLILIAFTVFVTYLATKGAL
jgi:hypothetical protein